MKLSLGLGPSPGSERLAKYGGPLRAYLEARTHLEVEVLLRETFSEVADELHAGRLGFGWIPAATFARGEGRRQLKLLLQSIRGDSSSYFSVLFVRDQSPVRNLADLGGRRVAWVGRDSSAGYVLAAHALAESGIYPGWESFEGSHAAVVQAVASGEADAGATFCSIDPQVLPNRIRSAGWTETVTVEGARFRPLATFGPIPGDVLCAGQATSYGERALFASVVARMHLDPEGVGIVRGLFGADRFEIALPRHFRELRQAAERLERLEGAQR
ncbi:MAG: phosphate/phosphite/phosphonate ABC transporter substrate-binding protein [Myxococcales bacterium]